GQLDRETRLVPEEAALAAEAEVERDRPAGPVHSRESQPAGRPGNLAQPAVEGPLLRLEEQARGGRAGPPGGVLVEDRVEVRQDCLPVSQVQDVERPLPPEASLVPGEARLAG